MASRKYNNNSPWVLKIMGESLYIIPSPEDVLSVFKMSKALDFDPIIGEILGKYGVHSKTIEKMTTPHDGNSKIWMDTSIANFKTQLHPGPQLDILQNNVLESINTSLTWEKITGQ